MQCSSLFLCSCTWRSCLLYQYSSILSLQVFFIGGVINNLHMTYSNTAALRLWRKTTSTTLTCFHLVSSPSVLHMSLIYYGKNNEKDVQAMLSTCSSGKILILYYLVEARRDENRMKHPGISWDTRDFGNHVMGWCVTWVIFFFPVISDHIHGHCRA